MGDISQDHTLTFVNWAAACVPLTLLNLFLAWLWLCAYYTLKTSGMARPRRERVTTSSDLDEESLSPRIEQQALTTFSSEHDVSRSSVVSEDENNRSAVVVANYAAAAAEANGSENSNNDEQSEERAYTLANGDSSANAHQVSAAGPEDNVVEEENAIAENGENTATVPKTIAEQYKALGDMSREEAMVAVLFGLLIVLWVSRDTKVGRRRRLAASPPQDRQSITNKTRYLL